MKMEGENSKLKVNLMEWRFSQYPKYILLPISEYHEQIRANIKNVIFSEVTKNLRALKYIFFLQ